MEQHASGSSVPANYKSLIFPSFMVTSKKHYIGMLKNESLYTNKLNYVRKSGSTLSSYVTEGFIRIALSSTNLGDTRIYLCRICSQYKWKVGCGKYLSELNIRMTYMGRKANYIRLISTGEGKHTYIEAGGGTRGMVVNVEYCYGKIKKYLELVTEALGIDMDPIYVGMIANYRRNITEVI